MISVNGDGGPGDASPGPSCGTQLFEPMRSFGGYLIGSGNLVADAANLYWIDAYGQLLQMPKKAGSAARVLTQGQVAIGRRNVALSDDAIYFSDPEGNVSYIKRIAKSGGDVTTLTTTAPSADEVHLDGEYVYWTTAVSAGSPVWRVPIAGGDAIPLAYSIDLSATPEAIGLGVDDANLYFTVGQYFATDTGTVYRGAKDGSEFTALATAVDEPGYLSAADADFLYFAIGLFGYDSTAQQVHTGQIARVPKNAAGAVNPEIIASNLGSPFQIVLDGSNIYWINQGYSTPDTVVDSTIMRVAKPPVGGSADPPTVLADCAGSGGWTLTVDDTSVYYMDQAGRIWQVAK